MQDTIVHSLRAMLPLLLACLPGFVGCSTGATDKGTDSNANGQHTEDPAITSQDDLRDLAERYLLKETDSDGANAIIEEIRGLPPADAQLFVRYVRNLYPLQYMDGKIFALSNALDELASERGVNRFAVSRTDVQELLTEAASRAEQARQDETSELSANSCAWYETACNWTSVWTVNLSAALCGGTCNQYNGIWNDRIGNAPCEVGGCDYRIGYSLGYKPTHAGGRSAAAWCLVTYYSPNIIAHQFSSTAYALFGVGGMVYCAIPGGGYLQSYTYTY